MPNKLEEIDSPQQNIETDVKRRNSEENLFETEAVENISITCSPENPDGLIANGSVIDPNFVEKADKKEVCSNKSSVESEQNEQIVELNESEHEIKSIEEGSDKHNPTKNDSDMKSSDEKVEDDENYFEAKSNNEGSKPISYNKSENSSADINDNELRSEKSSTSPLSFHTSINQVANDQPLLENDVFENLEGQNSTVDSAQSINRSRNKTEELLNSIKSLSHDNLVKSTNSLKSIDSLDQEKSEYETDFMPKNNSHLQETNKSKENLLQNEKKDKITTSFEESPEKIKSSSSSSHEVFENRNSMIEEDKVEKLQTISSSSTKSSSKLKFV